MARKPRIHIVGGYYHVMLRGNFGADIFFNDEDRYHFYLLMQEGAERFSYRIHAFCLMGNHVHLVIQVGDISLSKLMQNLAFRYTYWINRRQQRVGHLFQGRFKALLVDEDCYLLELIRYVHLNPVRASLVADPSDYPWSSHAAYLGDETLPWLESKTVLSLFSKRLNLAKAEYLEFIGRGMNEAYRAEFHCGKNDSRIIGDNLFVESVLPSHEFNRAGYDLDDCIDVVCRYYSLQASELSVCSRLRKPSEARAVIAWLAQQLGIESLSDVANRFCRDVSTMSTAVRRLEGKMLKSSDFKQQINMIFSEIIK